MSEYVWKIKSIRTNVSRAGSASVNATAFSRLLVWAPMVGGRTCARVWTIGKIFQPHHSVPQTGASGLLKIGETFRGLSMRLRGPGMAWDGLGWPHQSLGLEMKHCRRKRVKSVQPTRTRFLARPARPGLPPIGRDATSTVWGTAH